jgi:hypothetical protein
MRYPVRVNCFMMRLMIRAGKVCRSSTPQARA